MKNKKGFTLIEIISVVIIIGILGIIGIVAISSYVESSKQTSFLNVAKMYLDGAKLMKSDDKLFHDPKNNEAVLIPLSEIEVEDDSATKTPYGEIDFDNSYVVIVNEKGKYSYYITLRDETGHAFILENINTLSEDKIVASENGSGIHSITNLKNPANNLTLMIGEVKFELSNKNLFDGTSGEVKTTTILLDNSVLGEFDVEWNNDWTNDSKTVNIVTYNDEVTYQFYVSNRSQKPLASDSGWTDQRTYVWDVGTYYVFAKNEDGKVSDPEEIEIYTIDRVPPTCTLKIVGTPSAHGIYNSSVTVKIDKVSDGTEGRYTSGVKNQGIGGLGSGDSVTDSATGVKTTVYTGYVEDHAGNTNTCTATVKTDGISPTVSYSLAEGIYGTSKSVVITPSDGSGGVDYYNVRVTKDGTNIENKTNITSSTYTVNLSAEGEYVIYTKVLDTGGNWLDTSASSVNSNGEYFKTYKIDTTKPICTLTATGTIISGDYYGSDVNINFGIHDDQTGTGTTYKSGIKNYGIGSVTGSKTAILSTDSEGTTYTGHIEDQAGNTNTCTLTVKRKTNYSVTYNTAGGSCPSATKSVVYGQPYGPLCSPAKSGYKFVAWYSDSALTKEVTATTTFKNETTTLYAKWAEDSYTVTFNANGGTTSTTSKEVIFSSTYGSLPTPTRTGYNFAGWYTLASGGNEVTETTPVTSTANHTLYAHWTAKSYTVTLNANGGSVSSSSISVSYLSTYGTLPNATRGGYSFLGWYTDPSAGTKVNSTDTYSLTTNQTLYAHWKLNAVVAFASYTGHGFPSLTTNTAVDNDTLKISFKTESGKYEKVNIPIQNLETNSYYILCYGDTPTGTFAGNYVYGSTIQASKNTGTSQGSMVSNTHYMLKATSMSSRTNQCMTFKATATTMYWVWEFSRFKDGNSHGLTLTFESIEKIPSPSSPYVDLPNSSLHGFATVDSENKTAGLSYISKVNYNMMNSKLTAQSGKYEKINIPLVGLTSGKTYTLTFTEKFTGTRDTSYYVGFKISASKLTGTSSSSQFSDNNISSFGTTRTHTLTFTASASTMYLVWSLAGISDGTTATFNMSDVSIVQN